jgi:hypothetical protein
LNLELLNSTSMRESGVHCWCYAAGVSEGPNTDEHQTFRLGCNSPVATAIYLLISVLHHLHLRGASH